MSTDIGFGIIGTGMIADYHARAIKETRGARLVGVAGRSAERTRALAEKLGAPFWTTDMAELVARPDIQVVCIVTPSGAHLEPALAAIRAGKHVMVEKPMEISLERVDALLGAAKAAGVRAAGIFQFRFGTGSRRVKAALEAGRFGKIVLASAYVKWLRTPEYYRDSWHGTLALDGGAVLINQAIHTADLLQWFVGLPAEVFAWTTRRVHTGIEGEDTVAAALRFPGGALGALEASTALYPGWSRRIEIGGENGSIALEDDQITRWDFREKLPGDETALAAADGRLGGGSSSPSQISHQGHLLQIQDMVDSLQAGRPPVIDGAEARKAVAFVRAVYDSAKLGLPVKL